jgi:hypothetical protein
MLAVAMTRLARCLDYLVPPGLPTFKTVGGEFRHRYLLSKLRASEIHHKALIGAKSRIHLAIHTFHRERLVRGRGAEPLRYSA